MVQCLFRWKFELSSTKMPNGCEHLLLGSWKKCCSVSLFWFTISLKAKGSQSKRRNLECNQRFWYGEIPSPRHGWTQHKLECTWLAKWPPSYQWCIKKHWTLVLVCCMFFMVFSKRNDQTWMGHRQDTESTL